MTKENFIVREPLLDRNQKVIGFQLSWQNQSNAVETDPETLRALIEIVESQFQDEEKGFLLGDSVLFLEAVPTLLKLDVVKKLSPANTVFILSKRYFNEPSIFADIQELRQLGFGICVRNVEANTIDQTLLDIISHIEVKLDDANFSSQARMYATLKQTNVQLIARNVGTWKDFEACSNLGLSSFVGKLHLIPRPGSEEKKGLNTTQTTILQLMEMIRKNADIHQLETVVKRDAALAYKLLRYINSAGFGLRTEIQSLKHAVTILGYSPLYRWLSLLLATASASGNSPVLLETAIVRGRFAELLGQSMMSKAEAENLFVAGMFSLLDRLLGLPMAEVLSTIQLPEAVVDALITRGGMYGPYLALAEACELNSMLVQSLSETLKISADDVNKAHLSALVWAKNIISA